MSNTLYIVKHYLLDNKFLGEDQLGKLNQLKKIGITDNLKNRIKDLSGTKSPIKAVALRAWNLKGISAEKIEKGVLHNILSPLRVEGEWFFDEDGTLPSRVERLLETLSVIEGFSFEKVSLDELDTSTVSRTIRITDEEKERVITDIRDMMTDRFDGRIQSSFSGSNNYCAMYTTIRSRIVESFVLYNSDKTFTFKCAIQGHMGVIENQEFCHELLNDFASEYGYETSKSGGNIKIVVKTLDEYAILFDQFLTFIK